MIRPFRPGIRVLVVDDNENFRRSIVGLIATEDEIEVVGIACDGVDAIEQAEALKPDLVLMDLTMPRVDGFTATWLIKQKLPQTRVIIVTQYETAAFGKELLAAAGAGAYVTKDRASRELIPAVRKLFSLARAS